MFNVNRPEKAPASLNKQMSYSEEDVLLKLKEIFYEKCYLCETKEPQDINVEHFTPHKGDVTKKFDWTNLYLVCSRCNNVKKEQYDDLIDCCDPDINVSLAIKCLPPRTPYCGHVEIKPVLNDEKTQRTAELLDKIFNSEYTINKTITASYLRKKVFRESNKLLKQINIYFKKTSSATKKEEAINKIKCYISKENQYSAFMRWLVLDDEQLKSVLEEFMD